MKSKTDRENKIVIRWRMRAQAQALAPTLAHAYPPDDTTGFNESLEAIDEAERNVWGELDPAAKPIE